MKPTSVLSPVKRLSHWLQRARFLSVSIFLHLLLVLALGGVVLLKTVQTPAEFNMVGDAGFLAEETGGGDEAPELAPEEFQEMTQPASDAPSVATASVLSSLSDSAANFTVPTSLDFQPSGAFLLPEPTKGSVARLGNTGGGSKGGVMGTLFGTAGASANGLVGYMYDLKQAKAGGANDMAVTEAERRVALDPAWQQTRETERYNACVKRFVSGGWNQTILDPYFRAPTPLTITQILIPKCGADLAPKAFGVGDKVSPRRWLVHYKGVVKAPQSGAFRFVGYGDDVLVVRFAGRNVLEGSLLPIYTPEANDKHDRDNGPGVGQAPCRFGDWFEVRKGNSYPMEVLLGESPGGHFSALLFIQEKGKTYANRPVGGLALPVFQTAPTPIRDYVNERSGPAMAAEPFVFAAEGR